MSKVAYGVKTCALAIVSYSTDSLQRIFTRDPGKGAELPKVLRISALSLLLHYSLCASIGEAKEGYIRV